jgi:hypothetical protein
VTGEYEYGLLKLEPLIWAPHDNLVIFSKMAATVAIKFQLSVETISPNKTE